MFLPLHVFRLACVFHGLALLFGVTALAQTPDHPERRQSSRFVENRGQVIDLDGNKRGDVLFAARVGGGTMYLRRTGVSHVFVRVDSVQPRDAGSWKMGVPPRDTSSRLTMYRMDMELDGANPSARVESDLPGSERYNYYRARLGGPVTGVGSYGRVTYHDIYPAIDLVFHAGEDGALKYDFVVRPGGDPRSIRMRYIGAHGLDVTERGTILARTPYGQVEEGRPDVFQVAGMRRSVACSYAVRGNTITFDVAGYDRAQVLTIDPTLDWSTYVGGVNREYAGTNWDSWGYSAHAVRTDRDTTITMIGATSGNDFPTTPGTAYPTKPGTVPDVDIYMARFSHKGNLIWGTYIGGTSQDRNTALAVDNQRSVYLAGTTYSTNFPVTPGAFHGTLTGTSTHSIIAKFDNNGLLVWSTFFNGALVSAIDVDRNRDIVVGGTAYASVVATAGAYQTVAPVALRSKGFLGKFTTNGVQLWCTFFGGTPTPAAQNYDAVGACRVDSAGNIYAAGATQLVDFPIVSLNAYQTTLKGRSDGWIAKLTGSGTPIWSTYYGGVRDDYCIDITVDRHGYLAVSGMTESADFPVSAGAFQTTLNAPQLVLTDGFVARFDTGGRRSWSTYYGGTNMDYGMCIDADTRGQYWVGFSTGSTDFSLTGDAYQPTMAGGLNFMEAAVVKFDTNGARLWASYLGGDKEDRIDGLATSPYGCVIAGSTASLNFPTTNGAFQTSYGGGIHDAFLASFCDITPAVSMSGPASFCPGDSVILTLPDGYTSYLWSNNATGRSIVVKTAGDYEATMVASNGCQGRTETIRITVHNVVPRRLVPSGALSICQGDSVRFSVTQATGVRGYRWPDGSTSDVFTARSAGRYFAMLTDSNGCTSYSDTLTVVVNPRPVAAITASGPLSVCEGERVTLDASHPTATSFLWSTGQTTPSITVTKSGTYSVRTTNADGCTSDTAARVVVVVHPRSVVAVRNLLPTIFCEGDSTVLVSSPRQFVGYRWSNGDTTWSTTVKAAGTYKLVVTDTNGCTAEAQVTVEVTPLPRPNINAGGPVRFCQGDSVRLLAGGGVQYQWSNGGDGASTVAKYSGKYFVLATNENGCVGASDTITVEVIPRPVRAIGGPSTVCRNGLATYVVMPADSLSYAWDVNGVGASITSGAGTNSIAVRWGAGGTGSVHVRITNRNTGCTFDTALAVTVGESLTPVITADRSLRLCVGDSVTLDAGVYSTYAWSNGATTRTITVAQAGTYTVSVADGAGCAGTALPVVVTKNDPPAPVVQVANGGHACAGDTVQLDAGPGYASYAWSNGFTTQRIAVRVAGPYRVTVVDTNGCEGTSAPATVVFDPLPTPVVVGPRVVCRNSHVGYSTPATPGSTYTWSVDGGVVAAGQGSNSIQIEWGTGPVGAVTVEERTSAGCVGRSTVLAVEIGDKLVPDVTPSGPVALCEGKGVELDAGAGYAAYLWSTGATTRMITVSTPGAYTVTVTDAGGCTGTSAPVDVSIGNAPRPVIVADGPLNFCEGDSVELDAGAGFNAYLWSTGATTRRIVVRASGVYAVTVTDASGCTGGSPSVQVTVSPVPPKPTIAASAGLLNAPSGYASYQWFEGGTEIVGATAAVYPGRAGLRYRVRVINQAGCGSLSDEYSLGGTDRVVWLDTATAVVGERLRLVMHIAPPLVAGDEVTGYTAVMRMSPRALFVHDVISPDRAVTGERAVRAFADDGLLTVTRAPGVALPVGGELFTLELEGLAMGSVLNPVLIERIDLAGAIEAGVAGNGLVILSGCEIGHDFEKQSRIVSVGPNPARDEIDVRYWLPSGGLGRLLLMDAIGRIVLHMDLKEGSGGETRVGIPLDRVPSGVYVLQLVNATERSVVPLIINK